MPSFLVSVEFVICKNVEGDNVVVRTTYREVVSNWNKLFVCSRTDEETYTVRPLIRKLMLFKSSQKCVMADRSISISSSVHLLLKLYKMTDLGIIIWGVRKGHTKRAIVLAIENNSEQILTQLVNRQLGAIAWSVLQGGWMRRWKWKKWWINTNSFV